MDSAVTKLRVLNLVDLVEWDLDDEEGDDAPTGPSNLIPAEDYIEPPTTVVNRPRRLEPPGYFEGDMLTVRRTAIPGPMDLCRTGRMWSLPYAPDSLNAPLPPLAATAEAAHVVDQLRRDMPLPVPDPTALSPTSPALPSLRGLTLDPAAASMRTSRTPKMRSRRGTPPDDNTSLIPTGFELGNYVIHRQIAKGGMGVVYEGEHKFLHRKVAVKVLRQSRLNKPELVRRFFNEAIAATKVGHPGVVEVIDFGHAPDGAAYLVMELLHGSSLADRLDDQRQLGIAAALAIGRAIADTMASAHAAGIVHRDLKPDNVFLVYDESINVERVKVLDFGVAKFLQPIDSNATRSGKLLGTPFYMSPEQAEGKVDVDHRSDIYSLGCLLFEMLTGRCPFAGNAVDVLLAHRKLEPPPLRHLNPSVPIDLEELIKRMMAKNPAARVHSMAQVVAELGIIENRLAAGELPMQERMPEFARGSVPPAESAEVSVCAIPPVQAVRSVTAEKSAQYRPPMSSRTFTIVLWLLLLATVAIGAAVYHGILDVEI